MTSFQELTKFTRVNKIDTGKATNLAFAQTMYPMQADSCNPNDVQQYDPVGRLEPTTDTANNLCANNHWQLYDVETATLRPELVDRGLKTEHEDTFLGAQPNSFVRTYGISVQENVTPVQGSFQDFLSAYAQSDHVATYSSFRAPMN